MGKMLLLFLLAQPAGETTILNASLVRVDLAGRTISIRDAGVASGVRQLAVGGSAVGTLGRLRSGNEVLLTLRGATVVDIKISRPPAGRAGQQAIPQLPPSARTPTNRAVPQLPPGVDPPQGRPIPQVVPGGVIITTSPSPGVSPAGVAPTRPAQSPVAVRSPRSPGTPRPVVLPSDPPPSPLPD